MTNSIRTEIELLQNTKYENRIAIMEKGVTVYGSDQYSIYPTRIGQISSTPGDKDTLMKSIIDRSITSIDIPNGTTKIKSQCFTDCTLLNTVTIPNTVTVIGNGAFRGCSSLTSVEIPSSVTELVGATFIDCTGLTSITFMSDTPPTLSGTPFDGSYPIYVPAASVDAYKTAWPQYASRIVGISPYATFNSIVDRSISGDYTIPSDVTVIGSSAFYGCTSLTSVTIHSGVTSIGSLAFYNCTGLTSVTVLATTPPVLGSNNFNGSYPIYVPAASVETYKTTTGWTSLASRITAIPS